MKVEVVTPEDYMGDVMGDLSSRRGRIGQMEARGNTQVVNSTVPLSEMFGYSTTCVHAPRGVRRTPCSSRSTNRCPPQLPTKSSSASAASNYSYVTDKSQRTGCLGR